jgi:uncharacterized protein with PIN domain
MKFLCDDNLGKLAKYLRLLGYDTFYLSTISDGQLLAAMLKENRLVLTRDHRLATRIDESKFVLITDDIPEKQLRQIVDKLKLKPNPESIFSRCLICNDICIEIAKDDIKNEVFPYILKSKERFRKCPSCGRIFWQGSHYKNMLEKLQIVLGSDFSVKGQK